ncbi:hypothetical protein GGX14DRAFT_585836 [Mycena pura]|uniref:F-box domain-containing protein n=1 Tax=Mycena pura TaxID=153505 RepID=A0AAD6YHB2_9AGAR|nr:hypothetical protein GGX14DRAFT_585836 [Mycena pura]
MEAAKAETKSRKFFSGFKKAKPLEATPSREFDLPYDILVEIVAHLPENSILKLCLVSRFMFNMLSPVLYASVNLKTSGACRAILERFTHEPHMAAHMRRLTVQPNHPSHWGKDKPVNEQWVAVTIERLASSGHLEQLQAFIWDGLESPPESLWLALRLNCPQLRTLGTSVGLNTQKLAPESHLFAFRDLTGFSLVTQKLVRWNNILTGQQLPDRLWEMLLVHSPNLTELTIDGTCLVSQLWITRKIFTGRWRYLRSLSLGNISSRPLDTDKQEGAAFLTAHPRLENVEFFGRLWGHTDNISSLPLAPLPKLRTFAGKISHLKDILGTELPALQSIRLANHFSPAADFSPILRKFPSVSSLADLFSDAIRHTPRLRSFVLTLPRKRQPAGQSMCNFAMRTASRYPSLEELTIRDVADWDHADQLSDNYRLSALGVYHIVNTSEGGARYLRVEESGLGLLGRSFNEVTRVIPLN